jgi:hypothetical protein
MRLCNSVASYFIGRNQTSVGDSWLACRCGENGRILRRKWRVLIIYQDILARWFNCLYHWLFFCLKLLSSRFFSRANILVDMKIFYQRFCTALCLWATFELKAIPSLSLHSNVLKRWEMKRTYRGVDKSSTQPTSRCIFLDGENISFDSSLVIYTNSNNIPPIMAINRLYENQNLLSL